MRDKFYQPRIIWFCVWLGIFLSIAVIGSWQANLYWQDDLAKSSKLELTTIRTILPYAIAYLEDRNRTDLIQQIVNADLGPFSLVITDPAGKIIYSPQSSPADEVDAAFLKSQKFFLLQKDPDFRKIFTKTLTRTEPIPLLLPMESPGLWAGFI